MKSNKQNTSAQQGASDTMKPSTQKRQSGRQRASDSVTSVVAAGDGRDKNALTIPPRKERRKMEHYIWRRLFQEVGLRLFYDILADAVDQMLNHLERGQNGKAHPSESDLFASDGSLTDLGYQYVEEAFESVITDDALSMCETLDGLVSVLDKKCFTYFMIERAREKRARE